MSLDFDHQYECAHHRLTQALDAVRVTAKVHADLADNDRNGCGQINYRNVSDIGTAAHHIERALVSLGAAVARNHDEQEAR